MLSQKNHTPHHKIVIGTTDDNPWGICGSPFTTPTQLMAMLVEGDGEPLKNRVGVNII